MNNEVSLADLLLDSTLMGKALEEAVNEGSGNVAAIAKDDRRTIQVIEQNGYLIVLSEDTEHPEWGTVDRVFPLNGFDLQARQTIAEAVLKSHQNFMPPDFKAIITPLNGGIWYHDACSVEMMHPSNE